MDDVWLCVDEDNSSTHSSGYSDTIDSEIEAELYGMIHHQANLSDINGSNEENSVNTETCGTADLTSNQINDMSDIKLENMESNFFQSLRSSNTQNFNNPKEALYYIDQNQPEQNIHGKISRPLKRKLRSEPDSQNVIFCSKDFEAKNSSQLISQDLNEDQSKKNCENSSKKISLRQQSVNVEACSDSDDDVIWTEPDSSFKNDLKTNLFNDVDIISINSDSSESSVTTSLQLIRKKGNLKNKSLPSIKLGENFKDLWYINDADLYRPKKKFRRYHEASDCSKCSNCGIKGHSARSCPIPKVIKCFYCGGDHLGSNCRKRICSKCYNVGHDHRYCWINYMSNCFLCNMKGHIEKDCPDIWRRYHLTTDSAEIIAGKFVEQDRLIYCFNCGQPGHFGAECIIPRATKGSFTTWPSVISYSYPEGLLARRLSKRNANSFRRNFPEGQGSQNFFPEQINLNQNQQFQAPQHHFPEHFGRNYTYQNQHLNIVQDFFSERMTENQGQKAELFQDIVVERKNTKKKGKSKRWEFFKQRQIERKRQKQAILRDKDFPRTPKKSRVNKDSLETMPESVTLTLKQQQQRKRKNKKRKWKTFKQKQKFLGQNNKTENCQISTNL